jgi:hypothetical protein
MNRTYFILLILLIGIIGCKEDNSVNPIVEESPLITTFGGQFVKWTKGGNHRILFLGANDIWNSDKIYASSSIDTNGNFSLKNLDLPSTYMFLNTAYPKFVDSLTFQENTFNCSDSTAKVVFGVLIIVKDTSNSRVAEVYRQNFSYNYYLNIDSLKTGDFMTEYIYVDKDVNLKGKLKYFYYDPNSKIESRMTLNYNLKYKKGWNKKVTYIVSQNVLRETNKTIITAEHNYTNSEPSQAKWYYLYYL